MHRPVAAEGDEHERSRVDAAPRRDLADRVRHVGVHETEDALGGLEDRDAERTGDAVVQRRMRPLDVEAHLPAGEALRAEIAEHEVCVGHRRLDPTAAVAHRSGHRARALGTDLERARNDARDRPAARADRLHVDHRQPDQVAMMPVPPRLHLGRARAHQADVVARAAHVDRDEVADARRVRHRGRAVHAAGRTRAHDRDRLLGDVAPRHDPAVRLHDEQLAREAGGAEPPVERAEVALDPRADVGVHERRARALELGRRRHHLVRERHHDAGQLFGRDLAHASLVRGVDEREEEDDGERIDALELHATERAPDRFLVERHDDAALEVEPLGHAVAPSPRADRRRSR